MTPQGAFIKITKTISAIAKRDDVAALDEYIASETFSAQFAAVALHRRPGLMRAYSDARARCSEHKPVAQAGTVKADWKNPEMIARLFAAHARHGDNHYRIARELGVTEGSARRACCRYVVAATVAAEKPPRMAQDSQDGSRRCPGTPSNLANARLPQAA